MMSQNFLRKFRDQTTGGWKKFSAHQFSEVWQHYDEDGNGYIEGAELDGFLKEFIGTASSEAEISPHMLEELKQVVMEAYDSNADNRIEIGELAQMLPTEESFLLLFRRANPLPSSVEFMKTWREFDKDKSGYIESDELQEFLMALLRGSQKVLTEDKLQEYTETILQLYDLNKDGRLQLSEMAKLMPVRQNFLNSPIFQGSHKLTKETYSDIERVFTQYDKDQNGYIEGDELSGFLIDLISLLKTDYDANDLRAYRMQVMEVCDENNDGKLDVDELIMILMQQGSE